MNNSRYSSVQRLRVYLVMRKNLFAEGLRTVLKQNAKFGFFIQGHRPHFADFCQSASSDQDIDVLLISLRHSTDWDLLKEWKKEHPRTKIVSLSPKQDITLWEKARQIDLAACLTMEESTDKFLEQLAKVLSGNYRWPSSLERGVNKPKENTISSFIHKYNLTPRELQILGLISKAYSTKEIANSLFISDQTVSVHRKNIMRKLGVKNTAAVVRIALENNIAC